MSVFPTARAPRRSTRKPRLLHPSRVRSMLDSSMIRTRPTMRSVFVVLAVLACAAGCESNSSAPRGGGAGGGEACAPTAGAPAVDINGCPTAYVLPHYSGDTCGLCDPGLSRQCSYATGCDWAAAVGVTCSPDGTVCAVFGAFCSGAETECGWGGTPACQALFDAAEQQTGNSDPDRSINACASDEDCGPGHYCSVRVANRMFCDNAIVLYAKDYCSDAGTDAAADASDSGTDANRADAGL